MELIKQEDLIFNLFKLHGYKSYYDLGAYPTYKTVKLFNSLLDIGVNIYAFDPDENAYQLLIEKFGNKINSYKLGVGDKNKKLPLYSPLIGHWLSSFDKDQIKRSISTSIQKMIMSETIILYDFIEKNNLKLPDLIKVDVENWEVKIFKSIDFNKHRPIIIVEQHTVNTKIYLNTFLSKFYKIQQYYFLRENKKLRFYFYLIPNKMKGHYVL